MNQLVARLRASGLSADLVRAWIKAEVDELYLAREQAFQPPRREKYWLPAPLTPLSTKISQLELRLEKERLMEDLLGYDPNQPENAPYTFLPLSRQTAVKSVAEKYFGLLEAHRQTTRAMATPSEEATIARLETEQKNALSAWLTEDEQRLLNARLTVARWPTRKAGEEASALPVIPPVAERLRESLRAFDLTEKEFLAISAIQSEVDYLRYYGGVGSPQIDQSVNPRIRETLGEERFNQYLEKSSYDYARVSDLVNRLGLPSSVTTEVTAVKDRVISESSRISDDPSMDIEAKKAALNSVAQKERARIVSILGADGAAAIASYANRWLRPLEQGNVWFSRSGVIGNGPVGSQ